ncbi:MAG: inositol monophosphatase [Candidatus Omnitrophica bacterium]|nr:inositol monophosphatase [Candidatus Omnitrophota bacterium]
MSKSSLHRYLSVAVEAARRAGRLQARAVGRPALVETKRSPVDLVTDVDRRSERLICDLIIRSFPTHGIHGEEQGRSNPRAAYQWIIDPLDGTMNFVHGTPWFAVSIGLTHEGRPILGVIYDPMQDELFATVSGEGATLNGQRIHVSRTRHLSRSLLSTGFSPGFRKDPTTYLRCFDVMERRSHGVRRIGSTAVSLAYVACGRLDGFYERELWPWDIAAGIVLVQEAGGRITDLHGRALQRLEHGAIVASNGPIHREIIKMLNGQLRSSKASAST